MVNHSQCMDIRATTQIEVMHLIFNWTESTYSSSYGSSDG